MMFNSKVLTLMAAVLALALAAMAPVHAAAPTELSCTLDFNLHGWSVFYKTSSGTGTVTCSNGQSMDVSISSKGGGVTVGKTHIVDGTGVFSGVYDIREILGSYATAEAHAGTGNAVKAAVVTKGTVSLALTGKGKGWNVGVAFGNFIISKR